MDNSVLEERVFKLVISSDILKEYRKRDPSLEKLIVEASKIPNAWKIYFEILVSVPSSHPANSIENIFRRRLRTIPNDSVYDDKRDATKRLIDYCVLNPNANICTVTFNCFDKSYGVFCGREQEKIVTICVLTGGRIPKDVFKP